MGMRAQVRTPTCYVERIAHAGPSRAIGKSDHSYRIEAMRTIINASSGANANANHHYDIAFDGDSQDIHEEWRLPNALPFSVHLQNPFLLL